MMHRLFKNVLLVGLLICSVGSSFAKQLEVIISVTHPLNKSEIATGFNRLKLPKKVGIEFLPDKRWHMTLLYLDIPVPAGSNLAALKQQIAQDLLQITQKELSAASFSLPFDRFELWDRFYVATYRSNAQIDKKITEIAKKITAKYPKAQIVHKKFKPHISLVRLNPDAVPGRNHHKKLVSLRRSLARYDQRRSNYIVTPITIDSNSKIKIQMN